MKMVEHIGTVVAIEDDKAIVQLKLSEGCSMGLHCSSCASLRPEPRQLRVARADLEEGDTVCVSMPAGLGYVSMAMVFVLPVVGFIGGALIGMAVRGEPGGDLPIIVGGFAGLALAIGLTALVERKLAGAGVVRVRRVGEGYQPPPPSAGGSAAPGCGG